MDFKHKIALRASLIFSLFFIIKNFLLIVTGIDNSLIIEIIYKSIILLGVGIFLSFKLVELLKETKIIISFKNIFSTIFLMWMTAVFISFIFDFIFYNYIFPEFSIQLKEFSIQKMKEISMNYPNEDLEKNISELETTNIYSLNIILKGFIFSIPGVAILCSLISLIFNKK